MTPEQATAEAFARLMATKRGGRWLPVVRDQRDVSLARTRQARRTLTQADDTMTAGSRHALAPLALNLRRNEGLTATLADAANSQIRTQFHPARQGSTYLFATGMGRPTRGSRA